MYSVHLYIYIQLLISYNSYPESDDNRGLHREYTRVSALLYVLCYIVLLSLYYDRLLTYAATQIDRKNGGSCVD